MAPCSLRDFDAVVVIVVVVVVDDDILFDNLFPIYSYSHNIIVSKSDCPG